MKIFKAVTRWLFILCFPLLLFTTAVHLGASSVQIYEYGFDKYHISRVTGIDETQLSEVAKRLVHYFNSEVDSPQMKVLNARGDEFDLFHDYELIHLEDVKGLFQLSHRIRLATLAYVLIYALLPALIAVLKERRKAARSLMAPFLLWGKSRWRDLAREIMWGCVLTLALVVSLGVASSFGFEQMFLRFHYIAFTNPYWMLDPGKDYLIMLFPQGFWEDVATMGAAATALQALVLGGIAWAIPFLYRRRQR